MTVLGCMGDYVVLNDDGTSYHVMNVHDYMAMADRPDAVILDEPCLSVWIVPGTMTE